MKKNALYVWILLFVFSFQNLFSQVYVGQHIDVGGSIIDGYYDQLSYHPENSISKVHNSESFEKGYYYTNTGEKIEGYILFENKKVFYREGTYGTKTRIKSEAISSVVLGVDSFFQTTNFYFKSNYKTKPELVQYITEFNGYEIAKHYHFTSAMGQTYGYRAPIIEEFLIRRKDNVKWDNFTDASSLKQKVLKYFGDIPSIRTKVESNKFKFKDMFGLIKMAEYHYKYQNNQPIYFNHYWQETKQEDLKEFTAKITQVVDGKWTIEYHKDNQKLYSAQYSSFYPFVKDGAFIAYHSTGGIRQVILFTENKPQDVKTYAKDGTLIKHYKYRYTKNSYTDKDEKTVKFLTVNKNPSSNEDHNQQLLQTIEDKTLTSSYYTSGLDTIHQITDLNHFLNIKPLRKRFESFTLNRSYPKAIHENAQGTILVSLIMNPKGYIVSAKPLNTLHPEIDVLINDFLKYEVVMNSRLSPKLRPYKINKKKRFCTFVIPFQFSTNRFYRRAIDYSNYHYWNHMHHHQMHMNQVNQQILNNLAR